MTSPRASEPPSHKRQNLFIGAVLLLQIFVPLSYYLSGRSYDERFSWRMFSTLRLRDCNVQVTEHLRDTARERKVDVERDVHIAWLRLLERMRTDVVDAYLRRRCKASDVERVDFVCHCSDTDGSALPPLERSLACTENAR